MIDFLGDVFLCGFALYGAYAYTRDLYRWIIWKMHTRG